MPPSLLALLALLILYRSSTLIEPTTSTPCLGHHLLNYLNSMHPPARDLSVYLYTSERRNREGATRTFFDSPFDFVLELKFNQSL